METEITEKDYIRSLDEKAERRFHTGAISFAEVEENGAKKTDDNIIEGYAAVFNSNSEDFGGWIERISPGAFRSVLNDDAFGLLNHSMNHILGRNKVNITLEEDATGLKYRIRLPDTTLARDTRELVRSGIIDKSSFAFTVKEERFIKGDSKTNSPHVRIIDKVERLYDVSPVTIPAYKNTSVAARSFEKMKGIEEIQKSLRDLGREKLKTTLRKQFFRHNTNKIF